MVLPGRGINSKSCAAEMNSFATRPALKKAAKGHDVSQLPGRI